MKLSGEVLRTVVFAIVESMNRSIQYFPDRLIDGRQKDNAPAIHVSLEFPQPCVTLAGNYPPEKGAFILWEAPVQTFFQYLGNDLENDKTDQDGNRPFQPPKSRLAHDGLLCCQPPQISQAACFKKSRHQPRSRHTDQKPGKIPRKLIVQVAKNTLSVQVLLHPMQILRKYLFYRQKL